MLNIETLKQNSLFSALDDETLTELIDNFEEDFLVKGETLSITYPVSDRVYLIINGKVKITSSDEQSNKKIILFVMGPGDLLGEFSIVSPYPIAVDATAITNVDIVSINKLDLHKLLLEKPKFNEAYINHLIETVAYSHKKLMYEVFSDVTHRLAVILTDLTSRFGVRNLDQIVVEHGLTQEEISQLVGSSRETVNKVMTGFAQKNIITVGSKKIRVLDKSALKNMLLKKIVAS
ncbi:MAG: Crp/Fnr family transcriptional regulator [Micrococcaceae bacterium]